MIEVIDVAALKTLIGAGAAAAGTAVVEEATRDAYVNVKEALGSIFGRKAVRAVEKIENEATRAEGQGELDAAIQEIDPQDADELQNSVQALVEALRQDKAAQQVIQQAQIKLDLDFKGNVVIQRIQNAQGLDVKARGDSDFTLTDVTMADGSNPGKP